MSQSIAPNLQEGVLESEVNSDHQTTKAQGHSSDTLDPRTSATDLPFTSSCPQTSRRAPSYMMKIYPNPRSESGKEVWKGMVIFSPTCTFSSTTRVRGQAKWSPVGDDRYHTLDCQEAARGSSESKTCCMEMNTDPNIATTHKKASRITIRGTIYVPPISPKKRVEFTPDWTDPTSWTVCKMRYLGVAKHYPDDCFSTDSFEITLDKQDWFSQRAKREIIDTVYDCAKNTFTEEFTQDVEAFLRTKSDDSSTTHKLQMKAGTQWIKQWNKHDGQNTISGQIALLDAGGDDDKTTIESILHHTHESHFYPRSVRNANAEEHDAQELKFYKLRNVPFHKVTSEFCTGRSHNLSKEDVETITRNLKYIESLDAKGEDGYLDPTSSPGAMSKRCSELRKRIQRIKNGTEEGTAEDLLSLSRKARWLGDMADKIWTEADNLQAMLDGEC